jgi:hypothetical protein
MLLLDCGIVWGRAALSVDSGEAVCGVELFPSPSDHVTTTPARYAAKRFEVPAYDDAVTMPMRTAVCRRNSPCVDRAKAIVDANGLTCELRSKMLATGFTTNVHARGTNVAKAIETPIGRTTVTASKKLVLPRFEMTCTMMSPMTSSIIAALVRITPSRLSVNPLVDRIVKVVPREVEHSAAPAANAWSGVALRRERSTKERAIGAETPIAATRLERARLERRTLRFVERPPMCKLKSVK